MHVAKRVICSSGGVCRLLRRVLQDLVQKSKVPNSQGAESEQDTSHKTQDTTEMCIAFRYAGTGSSQQAAG
jgi:hypothetical protein